MTDSALLTVDCAAADAPARLVRSLRDTGFAVLTGHPIPAGEIAAAYEAWQAFFGRPDKDRFRFDPATGAGYFPFRSENAKGAAAKDLKEFFHVYPHASLPPAQTAVTRCLYDRLTELGAMLLEWIQAETPPDVRARFSEPLPAMVQGSKMNLLRVAHYPPLKGQAYEAGAVRAAAHEDINLITLLVAGSAPGLEARDRTGRWLRVPCDTGMLTVNAGDMLQKASGGYYPSTAHRVTNPPAGENVSRYSMPMFLHPRPEVRLDEAYTAGDYLEERLREIGLKA